jgi:mannose-6-phosphate isomerase-like protein (cupin superfamily)
MSDYAVKRIDEMEGIYGGALKRARAELGASSFGLGILDLPPNFERYPTHDHHHDGQEEVFVVLSGGGEIAIEGERHPLDADHVARVAPGVKRKLLSGEDGMRVLIVGGVPGEAYVPHRRSELGAPDPMLDKSLAPTLIGGDAGSPGSS